MIIVFVSFLISLAIVFMISKFGLKLGFVDIPNTRSSHKKITPRGGGIGIPIALLLIVLFFVKNFYLVIIFSFILSVFSLIDDKIDLPAFLRFFVEFGFAIVLIIFYKKDLFEQIKTDYGLIIGVVVFFFIAIIITAATNFFNFMDGINGIAGFEAIISFGLLTFYTDYIIDIQPIFLISLSIIASSAGFLIFNFPKARVFMGDTGSIFLGFLFVSLIVIIAKDLKELLILLTFQSVFYIDCISTIFLRIYRKENILKPHLQHLYQRLVHQKGFSHVFVTLTYSIVQIIIGIIAFLLISENFLWILYFWIFLFLIYFVLRVKFLGRAN